MSEGQDTAGRVVYLDPRITEQAVWVILNGASPDERFVLAFDVADAGVPCRWTDAEGDPQEQVIGDEVLEVTDVVWHRVERIREAAVRSQDSVQVQDIGAAVVNVVKDHAFHVVTDAGRRFVVKQWVDTTDDCEHLLVHEVSATPDAAA